MGLECETNPIIILIINNNEIQSCDKQILWPAYFKYNDNKISMGREGEEGNHAKSNNSKMPSVGDNDV